MYFYASVTEMYSLLQGLNPERLHKYAVGYACEELTVKICDKILQPFLVYSHVQSMQRFNAVVNSSCSLILSDVNPRRHPRHRFRLHGLHIRTRIHNAVTQSRG